MIICARLERVDALGREAQVQQRHALAGRGEQRPFDRVAQRPDPQRIAGHHHVAQRVEQHEAVRAVEPLATLRITSTSGGRRSPDSSRLISCMMISVSVVAGQVVVVVGQQLVAQLGVVGQLAVEARS